MKDSVLEKPGNPARVFYLTEIIGTKVFFNGERIGKLADMIIVEKGMPIPHITHLYVTRPFGESSLIVPLDKILTMTPQAITVELESITRYEGIPASDAMLINSYVLNKKVIDMEEREVSMVYDVKLLRVNKNMYVTDVDFSKYGMFRRLGLKWLADFLKIKEDIISWTYVQPLPPNIGSFDANVKLNTMKEKLNDIPPVDLADILEELHHEQRNLFFKELDTESAAETFEELDPNIQREMVSTLDQEFIARLLNEMMPGQAADIIAVLSPQEKSELLKLIEPELSAKIQGILDQQEQNITNYCTSEILKFSPRVKVDEIRDHFKEVAKNKDVIMYIYIVDSQNHLEGILDLKELLLAVDGTKLGDIMTTSVVNLTQDSTLKEAYDMFNRYGYRAIPVTDNDNKILGVLPYKDIIKLQHRFLD
jgi:DNA-directed RNA polymerase subunit F